ncbi:CorA family divalent cation transporter [Opitutus sp. ER46]|uniref:CorA family divalent cation transporter n=1 Tax=Opitutus sp. ER46 TaxID=2161864 RepID=UPI0013048B4B|nr:CorA family divalent cation transporter [Opitutus sp. ER46]
MIGTDFRFGTAGWTQRLTRVLLGEALLGFLALMSAALTLFPMLFDVSPPAERGIELAQWAIVAWFAVEYVVALASAPSKRAFLCDAWRWIDLATIVIPLASALPSVSDLVRSSPVLRLARLVRLFTLGVRASGIVVRQQRGGAEAVEAAGPARITRRTGGELGEAVPATRQGLLDWLRAGGAGWFHVSNPGGDDAREIGAVAGLPAGFLDTHLAGATHPHVAGARDCTAIFLWVPEAEKREGTIERRPLLILLWANRVLSFSRAPVAAVETMSAPAGEAGMEGEPLPLRVAAALLQRVVQENEVLVGGFEQQLRALEDIPLRESRPAFFEQTFRLKKQLSAAQWDLWRLKAVLQQLADERTPLVGAGEAVRAALARLAASADYLYETVVNTREDLLAVIDLHLNVVSFDMNRVMRVLAVVSVLGLIPAVIGGLLGMNLMDNPWHFTLPQVSFVVVFGMLAGLYFFIVKGWLR